MVHIENLRENDSKRGSGILKLRLLLEGILTTQPCSQTANVALITVYRLIAFGVAAASAAAMFYVGLYQSRVVKHLLCPVFREGCERLSFRSSFLNGPRLCVPYDCVEDCEELSQAGDDGDFLWPSARDEALVIGLDEGVVSGGDEGGHV